MRIQKCAVQMLRRAHVARDDARPEAMRHPYKTIVAACQLLCSSRLQLIIVENIAPSSCAQLEICACHPSSAASHVAYGNGLPLLVASPDAYSQHSSVAFCATLVSAGRRPCGRLVRMVSVIRRPVVPGIVAGPIPFCVVRIPSFDFVVFFWRWLLVFRLCWRRNSE